MVINFLFKKLNMINWKKKIKILIYYYKSFKKLKWKNKMINSQMIK